MTKKAKTYDEEIRILTDEEAHDLFDRRAKFHLKISGEDFLTRWKEGHYKDDPDTPDVMSVAMLLPLVENES